MTEDTHNNIWCEIYHTKVVTNEQGNCSLCGAQLHNLTQPEAEDLVKMFEDIAIERTIEDDWDAHEYLDKDENEAMDIAHEIAY